MPLHYLLFQVKRDFYMKPVASFAADDAEEAKRSAGFFMNDPDGVYRLYHVPDNDNAVFIECWQYETTLDEELFLDAVYLMK